VPVAQVLPSEVEILDGDKVVIANEVLSDALKQPIEILSQVSPVRHDQISVDEHGRVVVKDSAFLHAMQERLAALEQGVADADTNNAICCGGCNVLCGCSKK